MSLVGSLEDLGLGEILQIVSLSGKSGVLWIRSPHGEAHILFDRGAIRGAFVGGEPRDLRALVAAAGALPGAELDALHAEAQAEGVSLEEVLVARTAIDGARLDELRERWVESTVLQLFGWRAGEFSFEIRDDAASGFEEDVVLRAGMNAQFLALEGTRMRDEAGRAQPSVGAGAAAHEPSVEAIPETDGLSDEPAELEITILELLDDELEAAVPETWIAEPVEADEDPTLTGVRQVAPDPSADGVALAVGPTRTPDAAGPTPRVGPGASSAISAPASPSRRPSPVSAREGEPTRPPAAVLADPDLPVLEWGKRVLAELGFRAHIFPRSELAIQRIWQYFARGQAPLVILTTETPGDPMSGARDWSEIAARLRAQHANVPIVLLASAGASVVPASERAVPDAIATRPSASVLADERQRERRASLGGELVAAVERALRRPAPARPGASARDADEPLRALREWSARLREPLAPGEVLRTALAFAGREFDRALVLWVREGEAHAAGAIGFGEATEAVETLSVPCDGPEFFRKVFESRAPIRAVPAADADREFLARLGAVRPVEVYAAPVESGDQVAALLYADNASSRRPVADTSALEVILHEAALALDRAVLERALERVEGTARSASGHERAES
jgi:hypothetical protein